MSSNLTLSALPNPFNLLEDPSFVKKLEQMPSDTPIDHENLQRGLDEANELICSLLDRP
ncbi:hypothetical protein KKF55_03255 [Patescibacteria group bacterium]|nr:hypothetical protein [Patescibacteria group bacterium]